MARIARLVVPGYPHHITQRGSRCQQTFFSADDYRRYLKLLQDSCTKAGVSVWAYCLMPNHVHLVAVPETPDALSKVFRSVNRRYALEINKRMNWKGHLWQERFHSFVMDESHLCAAVRYIELNPIRASLCNRPAEWKWSSTSAHLRGKNDTVAEVAPMLERFPDWHDYLSSDQFNDKVASVKRHSRTGRPAGDEQFIEALEAMTNRQLKKRKTGPKKDN